MDYLQFQLKRAHLRMVAFGRGVFAPRVRRDGREEPGVPDMTPARFDLLYALHGAPSHNRRQLGGVLIGVRTQSQLRDALGVSKATVSKMLLRLEELGLVLRVGGLRDKRQNLILLTKEGLRRVRLAFEIVFTRGVVHRRLSRVCTPARRRLTQVRYWIYQVFESVRRIAEHFGDPTTLLHYENPFPDQDH
jgi:DNA-binding MarR family transcriptional regulator